MGTTHSPWRYGAMADDALQTANGGLFDPFVGAQQQ
jgi:hypothetical protein